MKTAKRYINRFLIILFSFTIISCFILRNNVNAYTITSNQHIYDDAQLLTEEEINQLNTYLDKIDKKRKIDIYILTANDVGYDTSEEYVDHFEQNARSSGLVSTKDSAYLLINMQDRELRVSGYGVCKRQLNDSRSTALREDITSSATQGNYYDAAYQFIEGVDKYMGKDLLYFQVWFQILVACIIGAVIVAIMAFSRGAHVTTNSNTYLDQQNSRIRAHHDNYIRTVVTKTRKPQNNSSGGGHGGGGGRSHSGSTGKF